ncbi:hypothetical protein QBC45DRAFT_393467 [Copromyces sp. CBS 386.78]|nr:hypothetical protein QBC45DRAFT_393467 [Copromyces sp. CBS 386.78]
MAEKHTDTAKALVPTSVHPAGISDGSQASAITDDKSKVKKRRAVDAVHDPSVSTKDICVQLEISIEDDPRTDLEAFSRFKRLGRFNDAKEFFETQLELFRTTPYVFVQYAEMLFAAGDFKEFRQLVYPDDFFHTGPALPNNELAASFELMKFLAQPLFVDYPAAIMQVVRTILTFLKTETIWGSTEIQLYTLCLQVMKLIRDSSDQAMRPDIDECYNSADIINWGEMYSRLLGEHRIWDFRDLFVTAISSYGWQKTASLIFGPRRLCDILEEINQDWRQSKNNESMILGLLDLFTTLVLQNRATEKRQITELLCIYSRSLAETVQTISLQHMKTRPFIQWILAKTLAGMSAVPQRSDGITLEDFPGLLLDLGDNGVHLPIFVPVRHLEKPAWDMFQNPANVAQIRSIEVAIQAAKDIGDYTLQSLGLKILALHSEVPGNVLDSLASLHLNKLGDREGFLQTCLSKYLTLRSREDEENLLESFKKVESSSKGFQNKSFINPTFLWARDVIRGHLEAQTSGELEKSAVWWLDLHGYGTKLPRYVVDFVSQNLGSTLSSSKRSISAMYLGRSAAQSNQALENNHVLDPGNGRLEDRQENLEGPMPISGNSNSNRPSPFDFLESDSALASLLYVPKAPVHAMNPSMDPHSCAEGQPDKQNNPGDGERTFVERVGSVPMDEPRAHRLTRGSTKDTTAVEDTFDRIANDSDSSQSDDASEPSTSIRVNKELPNLEFPPSLLDSNTLTVTVTSKTDPTKSTIYVIDKNGAVQGAMNADKEPSTKTHDTQPDSRKVEPEGPKRTISRPGQLAGDAGVTPRKISNPVRVKDRRLAQDRLQNWGHHRDSTSLHYIEELEAQASQLRQAQASHRQHQRDEDLAFQLQIKQIEAEATQLRNSHMAINHNDRTGYMPGGPVPLRPITRTLSDRFQLNQGIGRTSSWPMSMPPAAEYDGHWNHKRTTRESSKTRDSSKTRAARRAGISKEVLDQLNEASVSKNRRSGSVTAYNDPNSSEHSVVDGDDSNVEKLESLSDEEDPENDPALRDEILDRMKDVPEPPSRRKVQIMEGQNERTTAIAAGADSKKRTTFLDIFKTPTSTKAKGKEEKASQVRGSSESGAKRKPMRVSIQTEEEEEKNERNEQVEAKSESAEQDGQYRNEEEAKLAKENAKLDEEAAELEMLKLKKEKTPGMFTLREQRRLDILAAKFEERGDSFMTTGPSWY